MHTRWPWLFWVLAIVGVLGGYGYTKAQPDGVFGYTKSHPAFNTKRPGPNNRPGPPRYPAYPAPWAPSPFEHFLFQRPFAGRTSEIPLPDNRFGALREKGQVHLGIDIPAPEGTPIVALGQGTVVWTGQGFECNRLCSSDPYGLTVLLRHTLGWNGFAFYSLYAHMSQIWVQPGQEVAPGEPLGLVGETGVATGPHVHLEIRAQRLERGQKETRVLNPELWMAPYVGWGALVGRLENRWGWPLPAVRVYLEPETWDEQAQRLWWGYRTLRLRTYPWASTIHSDPLYGENFAVGALPAGRYRMTVVYRSGRYSTTVTIWPGRVTFVHFRGSLGFDVQAPLTQWPDPPQRWAYP